MPKTELASRLLAFVEYDSRRGILDVELRSGQVYRYFRVPGDCYEQLLNAASHGAFFNRFIRNCYPYKRLSLQSSPVILVAAKSKSH